MKLTERVELMFGDSNGTGAHSTRSIARIRAFTVLPSTDGVDTGLQIEHKNGLTLVTLFAA